MVGYRIRPYEIWFAPQICGAKKIITHYKNAFFNNINKMRLSLDNAKCRCYNIKREYNA